jgi:hypothetical protein
VLAIVLVSNVGNERPFQRVVECGVKWEFNAKVKVGQISKISLLVCAEIGLCAITGFLYVATPFSPDWIERVSGWDPDQHTGLFEWIVVMALLVGTLYLLNSSRS